MPTQVTVTVLGSLNYDLIAVAPRFPEAGESVIGNTFYSAHGGKGGNQAVAAARLGATVNMIGRVGDDTFGAEMLQGLKNFGVVSSGITVEPGVNSGIAHITIDGSSENKIVIVPGANASCGDPEIALVAERMASSQILLLQMELPPEVNIKAAEAARSLGRTIVLDPAPARPLPDQAYHLFDYLIPNETEATALAGFTVSDANSGLAAARTLYQKGCGVAIVKLGALGACYVSNAEEAYLPAFTVDAIDTVAAGDAFNGAFAVAIAEGKTLHNAVIWAMAAGAIAVTKRGAQTAMPIREEIELLLQEQP